MKVNLTLVAFGGLAIKVLATPTPVNRHEDFETAKRELDNPPLSYCSFACWQKEGEAAATRKACVERDCLKHMYGGDPLKTCHTICEAWPLSKHDERDCKRTCTRPATGKRSAEIDMEDTDVQAEGVEIAGESEIMRFATIHVPATDASVDTTPTPALDLATATFTAIGEDMAVVDVEAAVINETTMSNNATVAATGPRLAGCSGKICEFLFWCPYDCASH